MDLNSVALIVAGIVPSHPPEAPDGAPFGRYAWASRREGVPDEPDTELEETVYAQLKRHFASSRTGLPAGTVSMLSSFLRLGWYSPVLHAPSQDTLYRGMWIRSAAAMAALACVPEGDLRRSGHSDFSAGAIIPPANGWSTSWSSRKQATREFSESRGSGYAVTLLADVAQNRFRLLAGPGGLYDVDGLSRWHLEKETVGLEPGIIRRVEWRRL
jgi:hypothetical protein